MSPSAPARYLVGSGAAIRELAAWRWTPLLGLALVATAGVARHYDDDHGLTGASWFFGPLAISAFSSLLVFFMAEVALGLSVRMGKGMGRGYVAFLGLFWMTAPCAWLYAVPVEHWNDALGAAKWNVAFLVFVASWRVLIIARACQVLSGQTWWRSLSAVLMPAAIEFTVISWVLGLGRSIATSMGGVRDLDPREEFLQAVHSNGTTAGVVLAIAAVVGVAVTKRVEVQSDSTKLSSAARSSAESDL